MSRPLCCPTCQGEHVIAFGRTPAGNARARCRACGKTFCPGGDQRAHDRQFKERVLAALQERCSQRGACRIFGVSRASVARWLREKIATLPPFETTVAPAIKGDSLEMDAMWSFVLKKSCRAWVWLVLSYRTRQVVAYAVGDRSAATCKTLWGRTPKSYRRKLIYTDFWNAYFAALPYWQHRPCEKGSGRTNTVERMNNQIRQRLGRFVRKTLSFSEDWAMHEGSLRWFLQRYNTERASEQGLRLQQL